MRIYTVVKQIRTFVFMLLILGPSSALLVGLWWTSPAWRDEGPVYASVIFAMVVFMVGFLFFLLFGPKPKLLIEDGQIRYQAVLKSNSFVLDSVTTVAAFECVKLLSPAEALLMSLTQRVRGMGDRSLVIATQAVGGGEKQPSASGYSKDQVELLGRVHASTPNMVYRKIRLGSFSDAAEQDLVRTLMSWKKQVVYHTRK